MCGRASQAEIKAYQNKIYEWLQPKDFVPRRNLRPTEPAWIVARNNSGQIATVDARWWCQWDNSYTWEAKYPMFNARVDTMRNRKVWPELLEKGKRCILPVDSFYEWPVKGKGKPPVEIFVKDHEPFALAGLWSTWHDEQKRPRYSFATFTCEPNEFMKPLHDKAMPVILSSIEEQKLWLLDGDEDVLRPYEGQMEFAQLPDTLDHLYPEENQRYAHLITAMES